MPSVSDSADSQAVWVANHHPSRSNTHTQIQRYRIQSNADEKENLKDGGEISLSQLHIDSYFRPAIAQYETSQRIYINIYIQFTQELAQSLSLSSLHASVFLLKLQSGRSGYKLIICSPESARLSHFFNYNW